MLALVGLRGAGKSSIGAAVARRLGVPFVELDEAIVREAQMTLSTIFEIHGEAGYYRQMERDVLRRLLDSGKLPSVIATGRLHCHCDAETWGLLREPRAHGLAPRRRRASTGTASSPRATSGRCGDARESR